MIKRGNLFMNVEKLSLRFGGENDIDLETLSISLSATVNVLNKISDNIIGENDFCKFKVENIKKGSFVIIISQLMELAPTILPQVPTVLSSLKTILELRKMLNGKPPKEVIKRDGEITLINFNGNTFNIDELTFNVYTTNDTIEKNLAKVSKTVAHDNSRTCLSYEFETEDFLDKVEMNKEELHTLSVPQDVSKFNECIEENIVITNLMVRSPDLLGDNKWCFKYNEKYIYADIKDECFMENVRNGSITFVAGTKIKVELLVRFKGIKVLSYEILKVFEE